MNYNLIWKKIMEYINSALANSLPLSIQRPKGDLCKKRAKENKATLSFHLGILDVDCNIDCINVSEILSFHYPNPLRQNFQVTPPRIRLKVVRN